MTASLAPRPLAALVGAGRSPRRATGSRMAAGGQRRAGPAGLPACGRATSTSRSPRRRRGRRAAPGRAARDRRGRRARLAPGDPVDGRRRGGRDLRSGGDRRHAPPAARLRAPATSGRTRSSVCGRPVRVAPVEETIARAVVLDDWDPARERSPSEVSAAAIPIRPDYVELRLSSATSRRPPCRPGCARRRPAWPRPRRRGPRPTPASSSRAMAARRSASPASSPGTAAGADDDGDLAARRLGEPRRDLRTPCPRTTSSCSLVSSRHTATGRSGHAAASSASRAGSR